MLARPDYQLFDKPFFEAYDQQLETLAQQKVRVQDSIKALLSKDNKARRLSNKRMAIAVAVAASSSANSVDVEESVTSHTQVTQVATMACSADGHGDNNSELIPELSEYAIEAAQLSRELADGVYDMPIEIVEERARKLAEGFKDMNRADFKIFCDALERCGRNRDRVSTILAEETRLDLESCTRYFDLFMQRYKTVTDWQRIMDRADKGDKKALREQDLTRALQKKVLKHPNPWVSFPISYQGSKGKLYSFDDDIFIVLAMHKYGYGCWEKLSHEIRSSPKFRFDWFLKTRTQPELQRRADFLLRLIEKEIDQSEHLDTSSKDKEGSQSQELSGQVGLDITA